MTGLDIVFHDSQWPAVVSERLRASLRAGRVPGRFLYDSPAQSARWLAYHEGWSPARTDEGVQGAYDALFTASVEHAAAGPLQYVSLGCGGGQKDARWIARAAAAGRTIERVVLTDTSPALVLTADHATRAAGATAIERVVLDLTATPNREAYGVDDAKPTVWACLGILPNFEHRTLLPYLARLLGPEDLLIVSANLSPQPWTPATADALQGIVEQYDNPLARAWDDGGLLELGLSLAACRREMVCRPLDADGHQWRLAYRATLTENFELKVYEEAIAWSAGTALHVFQSTRYTAAGMDSLWAPAGLTRRVAETDAGGQEGVYLLRRAD